ncbi:MAG TPA: hypothetical protein VEB88_01230 [Candidatus Acidoferrales bacterium]|nr:hypothetical protein [Candidatus Acidoferrales bacterium]
MFTNEDDDAPMEEGFSSPYGSISFHTNRGDIVHGCHVRDVHRFAGAFCRLYLDDEKDAQGADGKARENAHAHVRSASVETLIQSDKPRKKIDNFLFRSC